MSIRKAIRSRATSAGVARVVIAVRNLDEAVKRYRQAFGLPEPIKQVDADFGAQLAMFGGSPVVLAAPLNAAVLVGGAARPLRRVAVCLRAGGDGCEEVESEVEIAVVWNGHRMAGCGLAAWRRGGTVGCAPAKTSTGRRSRLIDLFR